MARILGLALLVLSFGILIGTWCTPLRAQERVKIGFTGIMSGPLASLGEELLDGFRLKLSADDGRLAGVPVELILSDDQAKPDLAVQAITKFIDRDKVDLVMVGSLSNVLLAVAPRVFASKTVLLSILPGASRLAGKDCNAYYYNVSFESDGFPETVAKYLNDKGVKRVHFLAPNYQAGKDVLAGLKRVFLGTIDETFTPLSQLDFSSEISQVKASKPDAVYFFYPGALGIAFLKQWNAAGVHGIELTTHNAIDQTMLKAIGDSAIGLKVATQWAEGIDIAANGEFVRAFKQRYGRIPSAYAAQGYDGAQLIEAALKRLSGRGITRESLRQAIGESQFNSVRGNFGFNVNHYPIQDYFMTEVEKDPAGELRFVIKSKIYELHKDAYAAECKMQ